MSSQAEWRAGTPAPLLLCSVLVPNLLERKLWAHLSAKRCGGFKFRRQHRIGPYFANFCCVAQHLIIELDGSQHAEPEEERKDGLRTAHLNQQGYRVLRFWNEQVNTELEGVLQAV